MVDPYDYWCKESTPQDLKDALIGGDQERLRTWCEQNPESLASALECIHPQHTVYRNIVKSELSVHQEKEARETAEALKDNFLLCGGYVQSARDGILHFDGATGDSFHFWSDTDVKNYWQSQNLNTAHLGQQTVHGSCDHGPMLQTVYCNASESLRESFVSPISNWKI